MLALSRHLLVLVAVIAGLVRCRRHNNIRRRRSRSLSPPRPAASPTFSPARLVNGSEKVFGQSVVVENKPGASNQIAAEYVARSSADGYTLLVSPEATVAINPYLFGKLHYDATKDFVPVAGLVKIHQALVTNPSVPAHNVCRFDRAGEKAAGRAQLRDLRRRFDRASEHGDVRSRRPRCNWWPYTIKARHRP